MEVISASKLVSSETEKVTIACNIQTMNSFVMSHDLMRSYMRSHANRYYQAVPLIISYYQFLFLIC